MPTNRRLHLSYIHGPGDAFGTFLKWKESNNDDSIIKSTYSGQFYDLIKDNNYAGQVILTSNIADSNDENITFEKIIRKRNGTSLGYYLDEFEYAKNVSKSILKFNPDIIIVSSDFPLIFLNLLPRHTKIILSIHNTLWTPFDEPRNIKFKLLKYFLRNAVKHADAAVCVSHECERQIINLKEPSDITTFVQIPRLSLQVNKSEIRTNIRKLLYVGRIEENKGIFDLLDAFTTISKKHKKLKLEYVGDGAAMNKLRDSIPNEIKNRVIIKGRLNAYEVSSAYNDADLVVCPTHNSFNEGLATVPIEAAHHGVPAICSKAVPAHEYFNDSNLIFDPENSDDLVSKILALLKSEEAYEKAIRTTQVALTKIEERTDSWYTQIKKCIDSFI